MFMARTGYTGEDGFEIMLPVKAAPFFWQALVEAGVKPVGLGARDTLRLEAGMNLYGQDMDETVIPLESGLAWTVDLNSERDFIGKAALAGKSAMHASWSGLVLQDRGVLRSHQKVHTAHGAGEITSGTFSPDAGKIHRPGAHTLGHAAGRRGRGGNPRQEAEGKSGEISLRPQRQESD